MKNDGSFLKVLTSRRALLLGRSSLGFGYGLLLLLILLNLGFNLEWPLKFVLDIADFIYKGLFGSPSHGAGVTWAAFTVVVSGLFCSMLVFLIRVVATSMRGKSGESARSGQPDFPSIPRMFRVLRSGH